MQFVSLVTTCVTSPEASHASLVRPPRKSLDWMMAATRAHWLKFYTRYPIVARRAWPTGCIGRVRRASKGILHTMVEESRARRLTGWKIFQ